MSKAGNNNNNNKKNPTFLVHLCWKNRIVALFVDSIRFTMKVKFTKKAKASFQRWCFFLFAQKSIFWIDGGYYDENGDYWPAEGYEEGCDVSLIFINVYVWHCRRREYSEAGAEGYEEYYDENANWGEEAAEVRLFVSNCLNFEFETKLLLHNIVNNNNNNNNNEQDASGDLAYLQATGQ